MEEDAEGHAVHGYDEPTGTTSIYCCVLGDAAVCGLQGQFEGSYGIAVRDFGEVHDAPVFRTRLDRHTRHAPGLVSNDHFLIHLGDHKKPGGAGFGLVKTTTTPPGYQ